MFFCVGFCQQLIFFSDVVCWWFGLDAVSHNPNDFFSSTRCQCGPKTHMGAPMRLERAQCKGTFIFTLSRFNKSAIENSVYWKFCWTRDRWWARCSGTKWLQVMDSATSRIMEPVFVLMPSGFHCHRSPIHLNERYSRRCHNSQAAHAGWRLLGSADSTPLWLLSSFPSWVCAYLLSNSKTNHSQFLLEMFILVLFIPENSNSGWCVNTWWKLAPWHLRIRAVLTSCSKQSESITERDLTRNNMVPSKYL